MALTSWLRSLRSRFEFARRRPPRNRKVSRTLNVEHLEDRLLLTLAPFTRFTLNGDYVAAGVGLRGQTQANIALSGIPSGSTIRAAYLYWGFLDDGESATLRNITFAGTAFTGTKTGSGPDTCWDRDSSHGYRADVIGVVTGNGTYAITGVASGGRILAEGASLVVIYENAQAPSNTIILYDGNDVVLNGQTIANTFAGFSAVAPVTARTTFIVGDGQHLNEQVRLTGSQGTRNLDNSFDAGNGGLWDTDTYDISTLLRERDTSISASISNPAGAPSADCLMWVAQVISLQSAVDLALQLEDAIQPVQVSWQHDPGSPGEYPATDDMRRTGERSWAAGLPLIRGKDTRFFAYHQNNWQDHTPIRMTVQNFSNQPQTIRVEFAARDSRGRVDTIYVTPAYEIPAATSSGSPGSRIIEVDGPLPSNAPAFQFSEAGNWQIIANLTNAEGTRFLTDANPDNNRVSVAVEVKEAQKLRVLFKPLIFVDDERNLPQGFFKTLTERRESRWWNNTEILQATFPLAEGDYEPTYISTPFRTTFVEPAFSDTPRVVGTLQGWKTTLTPSQREGMLINFITRDPALTRLKGNYDRIVVLVPEGTESNPGMLGVDGNAGFHFGKVVFLEWDGDDNTLMHELGHSFGLYTAAQGEREQYEIARNSLGFESYGYWATRMFPRDSRSPTVIYYSFMGNNTTALTWIAKPDYRRLLERFTSRHPDPEVLLMRGLVSTDGRLAVRDWHRFDGTADIEPGSRGAYSIVLLDAPGNVLSSMGFDPVFQGQFDYSGVRPLEAAPFVFTVPFHPAAARVQIRGPSGQVLVDRAVSANAPVVRITSPHVDEVLSGEAHIITWEASDADGDGLSYSVYLSSDGGQNWSILAGDLEENRYELRLLRELPAGSYRITVVASDGINRGEAEVGPINLVTNLPPMASVSGPGSGVRGQLRTFLFGATDPQPEDQAAGFIYTVNWGDGTPVQLINRTPGNGSGTMVDHVYTQTGSFTVQMTAADKEGAVSGIASRSVAIGVVTLQADPCDSTKTALVVGGTLGNDKIAFGRVGRSHNIKVLINAVPQGTFAPSSRIITYGQAGNDRITVANNISLTTWLQGDAGNDRLKGGAGINILLGGEGNDLLLGGRRRDLLVGGRGADQLVGKAGGDILIAGTTSLDANDVALCAIMAEWTSRRDYATRVANLEGSGSGNRLNGNIFLKNEGPGTIVFDDEARDRLTGSAGRDWFFANLDGAARDQIVERRRGEFTLDID